MANHEYNLENKNNITYLEQNIFGKHFLKKQYAEIEYWKMKIEMISNVKNKEIHKLNEHMIKKKNIQDKINHIRIQYCDYIQSLMENNWLFDLENNFKSLTKNIKTETSKSNISVICNQLQDEINKMNRTIEELNLIRFQKEKLIVLEKKINKNEYSIPIWKEYIIKVEKEMSK